MSQSLGSGSFVEPMLAGLVGVEKKGRVGGLADCPGLHLDVALDVKEGTPPQDPTCPEGFPVSRALSLAQWNGMICRVR